MNFNQYSCNVEEIYLMQGILELYSIGYSVIGHTHFRLEASIDKYFGINIFSNAPNDFKVALNWEYIIEKIIYGPEGYIVTYQVKLL